MIYYIISWYLIGLFTVIFGISALVHHNQDITLSNVLNSMTLALGGPLVAICALIIVYKDKVVIKGRKRNDRRRE